MLAKVLIPVLLQFWAIEFSFSLHYGHEVGGTSMESTHYDRQTCSIEEKSLPNLPHQVIRWSTMKSISAINSNYSPEIFFIPIRKQFQLNRGENLVTLKDDSDVVNINITDILDMDQASMNISVHKQVRSNRLFF